MRTSHRQTKLQLVHPPERRDRTQWATRRDAEDAIRRENRQAATAPTMDPTDPRWVLAVRTTEALEGSLLTPERRAGILRTARLLGIRPFDANVIIAIAQDQARRGEAIGNAVPMLRMVSRGSAFQGRSTILRLMTAILTAAVMTVFLIWWLLGA